MRQVYFSYQLCFYDLSETENKTELYVYTNSIRVLFNIKSFSPTITELFGNRCIHKQKSIIQYIPKPEFPKTFKCQLKKQDKMQQLERGGVLLETPKPQLFYLKQHHSAIKLFKDIYNTVKKSTYFKNFEASKGSKRKYSFSRCPLTFEFIIIHRRSPYQCTRQFPFI